MTTRPARPTRRHPQRPIAASDRASRAYRTADDAAVAFQPQRPGAIELGAAVLIAAGAIRLVAIALAFANPNPPFPVDPAVAVAETALQVLTIVIGLLIRVGRGWIAAINVIAVLAFLEILGLPSAVSLALAVLFAVAFVGTFRNKPWFDDMAAWRASTRTDPRRRR